MGSEKYLVVARIMEDSNIKGFVLASTMGDSSAVPLESIQRAGSRINYLNAEYDSTYKTLVGKGNSLTNYPSINKDWVLLSKNGITVMNTIVDEVSGTILGVVAFNGYGQKFNLTMKKLDELTRKFTCCNFTLEVHPKYGLVALQLDKTMFPIVKMSKPKQICKNLGSGNILKQTDNTKLPEIVVTSFDNIKTSEFNQTCQEKLLKAMINMQNLTPYYYTLLQSIPRKPVEGFGTMGVTEDTLYYDLAFVAGLSVPALTFVLIHEMLHIAMQHSVRFGVRTNHDLWNIATDLYINTVICNDFNITFRNKSDSYNEDDIRIETPEEGVFIETIGETIDLSIDTPETIYAQLFKENPNYKNSQQGGNTGNNSGNKKSQNSKPQSQNGNQQSQNQIGDNESSGGNESNQNKGFNSNSSSNGFDSSNTLPSGVGNDISSDLGTNDNSSEDGNIKKVNVIYHGKKLTGTIMKDVMTNKEATSKEEAQQNIDNSRRALQRMSTKVKIEEEQLGEQLSKNCGQGVGLVKRYIECGLSAGIRWQELLRNMCKDKPKKTFTLAQPNQDYMSMGMTIADRRPIGKPTRIAKVKWCIDVSGSVSQRELELTLSEINNIFRFFKVDGELIYWSTMVGNAGNFSSTKDLLKIDPISDGGTNVRCVFDYLSGKTKVNGRYEQDKVKDIKAVFILTDGCFSDNYSDYERAFGKKVVWIISGIKGNVITFNPPFGRVLSVDTND